MLEPFVTQTPPSKSTIPSASISNPTRSLVSSSLMLEISPWSPPVTILDGSVSSHTVKDITGVMILYTSRTVPTTLLLQDRGTNSLLARVVNLGSHFQRE